MVVESPRRHIEILSTRFLVTRRVAHLIRGGGHEWFDDSRPPPGEYGHTPQTRAAATSCMTPTLWVLRRTCHGPAAKVHLGAPAWRLAALLNKHLGLTTRSTCRVLESLCGLRITPGGPTQAMHRVADKAKGSFLELPTGLPSQPTVYSDETSWWVGNCTKGLLRQQDAARQTNPRNPRQPRRNLPPTRRRPRRTPSSLRALASPDPVHSTLNTYTTCPTPTARSHPSGCTPAAA